MKWHFIFDARARKELLALDPAVRARIIRRLDAIADDPWRSMKPLAVGSEDEWKLRAGDYRLICKRDTEGIVVVVKIGHRSTIYQR